MQFQQKLKTTCSNNTSSELSLLMFQQLGRLTNWVIYYPLDEKLNTWEYLSTCLQNVQFWPFYALKYVVFSVTALLQSWSTVVEMEVMERSRYLSSSSNNIISIIFLASSVSKWILTPLGLTWRHDLKQVHDNFCKILVSIQINSCSLSRSRILLLWIFEHFQHHSSQHLSTESSVILH